MPPGGPSGARGSRGYRGRSSDIGRSARPSSNPSPSSNPAPSPDPKSTRLYAFPDALNDPAAIAALEDVLKYVSRNKSRRLAITCSKPETFALEGPQRKKFYENDQKLFKAYQEGLGGFEKALQKLGYLKARDHTHHSKAQELTGMSHKMYSDKVLEVYTWLVIFRAILVAHGEQAVQDWLKEISYEKAQRLLGSNDQELRIGFQLKELFPHIVRAIKKGAIHPDHEVVNDELRQQIFGKPDGQIQPET